MNKRITAAIGAAVLALLGVVVLVIWAQGANDRAFEGAELVSVVRTTGDIAQGTTAADLKTRTEVAKLPADAIPSGAVTDLAEVAGLSTNASLQAGEVLLESRFVAPGKRGAGETDVPKGFQELSFSVDAERSVGGEIKPGDKVGIVASFREEPRFTNFVRQNVLVTRIGTTISGEQLTSTLVTVAVRTIDVEKIVYAKEFGSIWVTLQNSDTDTSGAKPVEIEDLK